MRCSKKITRWCRKTRRIRRKIHCFGLKVITAIASINILFFILLVDNLTHDGWMLAAAVDIPSALWIALILRANGWVYDTPEFEERERRHHGWY